MLELTSDTASYLAIAAILALWLIARTSRRHGSTSSGNSFSEKLKAGFRPKSDPAVLTFKKCPKCTEQLPVSALVCDACDYNFLAGSILRHKLLPMPEERL